jgi:xanthine dehydrogenase small subunit
VEIIQDNHAYYAPHSIHDALEKQNIAGIRITAGSTDIGVQINKGYTRTNKVLDLRLISDLYELSENEEEITVGARVTWKRLRSFCLASLPDFATFLNLFASPQIRNVGTLVGNIANASPIGDSLPYLLMANARVRVFGNDGYREIPMTELYTGYKKLALHPGEFITHVIIPKPHAQEKIKLYKISARRDLDISCVNMACSIRLEQDRIVDFRLVYGGVGPVVLRMYAVERYLAQSNLSQLDIQKLVEMVKENIAPISDVRGSDKFRIRSAQNLLRKFFIEITKIVEVEKSL